MLKNDEVMNEALSLAIGMWALGLPEGVTITHAQRQELHNDILKTMHHSGCFDTKE